MQELNARQVKITDSFWSPRLAVNAEKAIFHLTWLNWPGWNKATGHFHNCRARPDSLPAGASPISSAVPGSP